MSSLTVLFDFKSPQSFLALQPTLELLDALRLTANWQPLLVAPMKQPVKPAADATRGELHRFHRARYRIDDLRRYATARGLPEDCFTDARLFASGAGRAAAAGYLWCQRHEPELSLGVLSSIFESYWQQRLDLNSLAEVSELIGAKIGRDPALSDREGEVMARLDEQQAEMRGAGWFDVPGYLIADQVYYGRQHLPMVGWHLAGEPGNPPAWGRYEH